MGFNFEFDTRDNIFSPHQGYRYTIEQLWFRESFGSDIDYELTSFQGLNYWVLNDLWRLGVKVESEYADSDGPLPPFATPAINLRGIPAMRYQGNFVAAFETELTWQADSRWSVNGFVGVGRASHSTSDFSEAPNRDLVGAFEGANYQSEGYYRSEQNCLMFTRTTHFCQVCSNAIEQVIDQYSKPAVP